jgi:hypothetical protein
MVLYLAITGYNKGSIDNFMTQKVVANTVHSVVSDVQSSTDVVTSISCLWPSIPYAMTLLGNHVVNCLWCMPTQHICFDLLSTHSLLSVLEKHGNAVPLVAELAFARTISHKW